MKCLIESPFDGPWRLFERPVRVLRADHAGAVHDLLAAADAALAQGLYVAGYFTYEAAAAFGLPVRHAAVPLACLGVYEPSTVRTLLAPPAGTAYETSPWRPSITRDEYIRAIAAIKARIEAGDTYQINFTFRLRAQCAGDPAALFAHLLRTQRGGWAAMIEADDLTILSASPELLYLASGGSVECRPMKGTIRRGRFPAEDRAQAELLRASDKDRAENIMIVDMTRNDLGAIARVGSVRVASRFEVERYPRQWQMTSRVIADVEDTRLSRLIPALFPSGSITGAPKHRSMQIIGDLEPDPRGPYTGAIGCASPDGRSHFNVAIRTVAIRNGTDAEFGVGSGVVWDSDAGLEYDECLLKASMLQAAPPAAPLLETMRWEPGTGVWLYDGHLRRMRESAEYFGYPFDEAAAREAVTRATSDATGIARVRLMLDPDGRLSCEAHPFADCRPERWRVAFAREPVDREDVRLFHKRTDRTEYERRRGTRPDVDTVLLCNREGEVTESAEANLVIEERGRKLTPALDCGLLPGVFRDALVRGGEVAEAVLSRDRVLAADRVWLVNSLRGWIPVVIVD